MSDFKMKLSDNERMRRFKSAMGSWKGIHDPEELLRNIYSDRLTDSSSIDDTDSPEATDVSEDDRTGYDDFAPVEIRGAGLSDTVTQERR